jgi:YbbR domain-containing protein
MIALLRHLFFDDIWLKLFSLALAILIWITLAVASQREVATTQRVFSNLPVNVMSATADARSFKVAPTLVDVTVQGEARRIENLKSGDIRVMVDLTGLEAAHDLGTRLEVAPPAGVTLLRISPPEVLVTKEIK